MAERANFLDSETNIGRLDFPEEDIFLVVRSRQDWRRLHSCQSEPETVKWIVNDLKAGDVLYDIGASTGPYSLLAALSTKGQATIYAFEPLPASFASLLENIVLNKAESVHPLRIALAAKSGFADFAFSGLSSGSTKQAGLLPESAQGIMKHLGIKPMILKERMKVFSLDDLVKEASLPPPTHIKIDVDGSEVLVLKGMYQVLRHPSLRLAQVEATKGPDGNVAEVIRLMTEAGFRLVAKHRDESARAADYLFRR